MECSLSVLPWQNCSAITQGIYCFDLFANGICDKACDSEDCLFDGYDCAKHVKECNPIYDAYCINHYANGHCDKGCDTAECNWDGGDCNLHDRYAEGSLIFILIIPPAEFRNISVQFLRDIGNMLHSIVEIERDAQGNEMIYPWPAAGESYESRTKRNVHDKRIIHRTKRAAEG